jgi:hypothetical protein
MEDNLLKQAIADAKQVKQLAAEAARMQLEEAFRPHLASMVSSHLRNEANINENNDDSSGIGGSSVTVKNPSPTKPSKATSDSSHIENPGLEVEDTLDGTTAFSAKKVNEAEFPNHGEEEIDVQEPNGASLDVTAPAGALDLGTGAADLGGAGAPQGFGGAPQAAPAGLGGEFGGADAGLGGAPDELDLEAIIRELELDSQGGMGLEEPQLSGAPDPTAPPKTESFSDPMAGKKVTGPLDGSNIQETLAGDGDEGVHKDGKDRPSAHGVPSGKEVKPGQEVTGTKAERMSESEEIDLDEILREMAVEETQAVSENGKLTAENVALKNSLREHRQVVMFLKDKLQEVNVLNAKLLYTNKLFKHFDLKLEQKKNIVESFDRANNVREVQIIFTTLAENFKGAVNTNKKSPVAKSITEGMASRAAGSTAPKTANILEEGDTQVSRMQKLAGIKKK